MYSYGIEIPVGLRNFWAPSRHSGLSSLSPKLERIFFDKVLFPRSAPAEKFRNKNVCIIFLRGVPFPHIRRDDSHLKRGERSDESDKNVKKKIKLSS